LKRIMVRLGLALIAGAAGLVMILVGVERTTLLDAEAVREGTESEVPRGVFILLVVGVVLLSIAVFSALTVWGRHFRDNSEARQAPVWVFLGIIVVAGGLGLAGYASHTTNIRSLEVIPTNVDWRFIALQGFLGTIVIAALVIMGVRWTPRHQPARAQR
jgi:drug/metabolite transporter (DMT)-like permease